MLKEILPTNIASFSKAQHQTRNQRANDHQNLGREHDYTPQPMVSTLNIAVLII